MTRSGSKIECKNGALCRGVQKILHQFHNAVHRDLHTRGTHSDAETNRGGGGGRMMDSIS